MSRPSVFFLAERPVFQRIAETVARLLEDEFAITVSKQLPAGPYDLALAFWWGSIRLLRCMPARRYGAAVYDYYSWPGAIGKRRVQVMLDRVDFAIFGNEDLARLAEATVPSWVCEDGVDTDLFQPAPFPAEFTAGWCGHSGHSPVPDAKGALLIEEACRRAEVRFEKQDIAQGGGIPQSDMPGFYGRISVYCCGSVAEGTPNPVLEAMASGRPVITTRVGVTPKLVEPGRNGVFAERSVEAFAAVLSEARRSWDLAAMGAAARRTVEPSWDWRVKAEAWRQCLRAEIARAG